MYAVELANVTKSYGSKKIFSDFNLQVQPGEMVAITGSSGAGKSTLLNMIGLIEPFDSGKLVICGKSNIKPNTSKAAKVIRENISYLFQNFALVDNESVENNLDMALKYTDLSKVQKQKLIAKTLVDVGLPNYEKQKIFTLSGGEQQRVAIARVLVHPKALVLADEPTGSLDPNNRDIVLGFLSRLNQKGSTVIVVTHDPYVAGYCKRKISLT